MILSQACLQYIQNMSREEDAALRELLEYFDGLTPERRELLRGRVLRSLGLGHEDSLEDADDPELINQAFVRQLSDMWLKDSLQEMQREGLIEVSEIREDGELAYRLTEEGQELVESNEGLNRLGLKFRLTDDGKEASGE